MARDWVEQVNEDRAKRFAGQPASDRVMQMQTAPLTERQQELVRAQEQAAMPAFRGVGATGNWDTPASAPAASVRRPFADMSQYPDLEFYSGQPKNQRNDQPGTPGDLYTPPDAAATARRQAESSLRGEPYIDPAAAPGSYRGGAYSASEDAKHSGLYENRYTGPVRYGYGSGNDDPWAFRNKIRGGMEGSSYGPTPNKDIFIPQGVGGMPGERVINDYGPGFNSGYGSTRVMATADKNGMFNTFTDVPGAPVGPGSGAGGYNTARSDPYGIGADIARSRMRAAALRGSGSNVFNNIQAAAASRSANKLAQIQQAHDFGRERFGPGIQLENAAINELNKGGLTGLQDFRAANAGHPNIITSPGIGENRYFRPRDVPEGGLSMPTMPAMPGAPQATPQMPQPLGPRPDMNIYFDPQNPYR